MTQFEQPSKGTEMLRLYNVERVRGYLERNLGCSNKECATALRLNRRTVARAIATIRGKLAA